MVLFKRSRREDIVETSEEAALLNELEVLEFVTVSIVSQCDGYKLQDAEFSVPSGKFSKSSRRGRSHSKRLRLGMLDCTLSSLKERTRGFVAAVVILIENQGKWHCLCYTTRGNVDIGWRHTEGWSWRWTLRVERKDEAGDLICEIRTQIGQALWMDWTWMGGLVPIEPRVLQVVEEVGSKKNQLWNVHLGESRRRKRRRVVFELPDWSSGLPGLVILLLICWLYGAVKIIIGVVVFLAFVFAGTYYKHWTRIYR